MWEATRGLEEQEDTTLLDWEESEGRSGERERERERRRRRRRRRVQTGRWSRRSSDGGDGETAGESVRNKRDEMMCRFLHTFSQRRKRLQKQSMQRDSR